MHRKKIAGQNFDFRPQKETPNPLRHLYHNTERNKVQDRRLKFCGNQKEIASRTHLQGLIFPIKQDIIHREIPADISKIKEEEGLICGFFESDLSLFIFAHHLGCLLPGAPFLEEFCFVCLGAFVFFLGRTDLCAAFAVHGNAGLFLRQNDRLF